MLDVDAAKASLVASDRRAAAATLQLEQLQDSKAVRMCQRLEHARERPVSIHRSKSIDL
jgi:hypothetical protein